MVRGLTNSVLGVAVRDASYIFQSIKINGNILCDVLKKSSIYANELHCKLPILHKIGIISFPTKYFVSFVKRLWARKLK